MITNWKIANFKTVRQDTELKFAPLTIFAGANSSGKSSWIQSILMISQTLTHRVGSRSVVLNGSLARLGQFDDLRSFDSDQREILIGWECQPRLTAGIPTTIREYVSGFAYPRRTTRRFFGALPEETKSVSCEIAFDTRSYEARPEMRQLHPGLAASKLALKTLREDGSMESVSIDIIRTNEYENKRQAVEAVMNPSDVEFDMLRSSVQFDVSMDPKLLEAIREVFPSARPLGCVFQHFLPSRLSVQIDSVQERARVLANYLITESTRSLRAGYFSEQDIIFPKALLDLLRLNLKELFPASLGDKQEDTALGQLRTKTITLRDWIEATRRVRVQDRFRIQQTIRSIPGISDLVIEIATAGGHRENTVKAIPLPDEVLGAVHYLDSFFSYSISYLGPLRDEPKPLYPLPTSPDLTYVGLRGEYTAAVLDLHRFKIIDYVPPEHFTNPAIRQQVVSAPLQTAVGEWLKYLGVADSVQTFDKGKLGHELQVQTAGIAKPHDLTHAGVGVSQVLPILVSCLISDFDTTHLLEQPELHLHPAVQSRLGDFFLSMALLGKQCIVETHSEYLINRLRFRIASALVNAPLSSSTKIYFVEKKADASTFREVLINDYGAIPDWPDGFFDQSQDEAERILRAASFKRTNLSNPL
jgi:predicted ATPase